MYLASYIAVPMLILFGINPTAYSTNLFAGFAGLFFAAVVCLVYAIISLSARTD